MKNAVLWPMRRLYVPLGPIHPTPAEVSARVLIQNAQELCPILFTVV